MQLNENTIISLQEAQQKSIAAKQLVEEQLCIIYENNWFNIWVPKEYNGLSYSLLEGFRLFKDLAYVDGGMAWTITLCSGANMFAGYMDPMVAKETFQNPKVCFGGSGRANGKAVFDGKRFTLSGTWQYATGAPHLTHFTLNAQVYDGQMPRVDGQGLPVIFSFFVPREHVLIHYDWNTFGLECTASHSFSLDNVVVSAANAFRLIPEERKVDSALFRIPFMTFAELTLLPNYIGMYKRFLDLTEKYFFQKAKDTVWAEQYSKQHFRLVDTLQQKLENDVVKIEDLILKLWTFAELTHEAFDPRLLDEIASISRAIVKDIREQVCYIFPLLGISGAQRENEINIVFRNIFTATQHSLLNVR